VLKEYHPPHTNNV